MPFHNLEKGMTFTEYTQKQRKMTFMGSQGGVLGSFWVLLGRLGGSRGSSWGVLGRLGIAFDDPMTPPQNLIDFLIDFDDSVTEKGCPKGGILGAKMVPKSFQKRSRKRRRKKEPPRPSWSHLGPILGPFEHRLGLRDMVFVVGNVVRERKRRF